MSTRFADGNYLGTKFVFYIIQCLKLVVRHYKRLKAKLGITAFVVEISGEALSSAHALARLDGFIRDRGFETSRLNKTVVIFADRGYCKI